MNQKILIPAISLFSLLIWVFMQNTNSQKIVSVNPDYSPNLTPKPAFYELTIPSLREREYEGRIIEKKLVSENGSYGSYLATYLSDGLRINGLLTVPRSLSSSKYPAIIFIHGYIPPASYNTLERYDSYVDYFASRGFVVFKIDLRGHGDSEGQASGAYYSEDYIVDTLNAYSALQKESYVNPHAIGLWGHSMAGNVVLRSLAVKKDIPAAVIWAGAVYSYEDLAKYGLMDNSYRPPSQDSERRRKRQELRDIHGDFNSESKFWRNVAPTNFLDEIESAISLHHAVNDNVVNIAYSQDLANILQENGIIYEFYEYPTGGHNIDGSSFALAMSRSVDFFNKYLRD